MGRYITASEAAMIHDLFLRLHLPHEVESVANSRIDAFIEARDRSK